jgi:tRNA (guanine9-N1)-methyltransferase
LITRCLFDDSWQSAIERRDKALFAIMDDLESPRKRRKLDSQEDVPETHETITPKVSEAPEAATAADDSDDDSVSCDETGNLQREDGGTSALPQLDKDGNPLSKNQLKKLRRRQEWEAGRGYRREKRKQKTAEKRARKRAEKEQRIANGEPVSTERKQRPTRLPISFIIDCGFNDLMNEKERISLGSQVTRAYSENYRGPFQGHLLISSWGGALKERFDTVLNKHYENWKGVIFENENFVYAIDLAKQRMTGPQAGAHAGAFSKYAPVDHSVNINGSEIPGKEEPEQARKPRNPRHRKIKKPEVEGDSAQQVVESEELAKPNGEESHEAEGDQALPEQEVVYLTSDSPNTLEELKPYSTYIIGGLVDKNRHKGICYRTACDNNIKTAKLPIGDFMEMQSRSVLATNHVVEIMLRWLECGDWGEAFVKVIPKRKGGKLRDAAESNDVAEGNDVEHDLRAESEADLVDL